MNKIKLNIKQQSISITYSRNELVNKTPVLFLHGFSGSSEDWFFAKNKLHQKFCPILIDLLGHGNSSSPENTELYSSSSQIEILHRSVNELSLEKFIIVGYSMGGRLALSYAMKYSDKVIGLLLESTSFGIKNNNERAKRIIADNSLSDFIEKSTIDSFIEYWLGLPLFSTMNMLPYAQIEELKNQKKKICNKMGLSNSLRGFSTGKMPNYFKKLSDFHIPVSLVTGKLDIKFSEIATKANELLPDSKLYIVNDCGHNVHFEKPEEFLKLLNNFLANSRMNDEF